MEFSKPILETERLLLRKPKESDAEPMFHNWANDPEVTKYLTWPPHGSIDVTRARIAYWIGQEVDPETIRYLITLKGNDEPFGSIDVVDYHDGVPEIGYCLARKLWGNGYMTEACLAFLKELAALGFAKAMIAAEERNIGSNRVIEKCGFVFTHKEYREHSSSLRPEPVTLNWYEKTL